MSAGIPVTETEELNFVDDVLCISGGTAGRISYFSLAAILAGSGSIASALAAIRSQVTSGLLAPATWADLSAITGSTDAAGAEVPLSDTGTHAQATATGYDGETVDNAGRYSWSAAWSRWVRIGEFGGAVSDVVVTLSGTANALSGSSDRDHSQAPYAAKFVAQVVDANTGPVTIGIDGGTARALLTNTGAELQAGELLPGMVIEWRWNGTEYRLIPGITTAAMVQRAEDAREAAVVSEGNASDSAGAAAISATAADVARNEAVAAAQAAGAYVYSQEMLYPASYPVPEGWYDTGERLLSGTSARAIMSNWTPASATIDLTVFDIANATMYQDMAGATPVAADGDPVAIIFGNDVGAGSPPLENADFDTDLTGWTTDGGGTAAWSAGKARVTRTTTATSIAQGVRLIAGQEYTFTAEATWVSGASAAPALVIRSGPSILSTNLASQTGASGANASLSVTFTPATTDVFYIHLTVATAAGEVDFDDVAVAGLTGTVMYVGNNVFRPTYRVGDDGRAWLEFDGTNDTMLVDPVGSENFGTLENVAAADFVGGVWMSYRSLAEVNGYLWTADVDTVSGAALVLDTSGDYFRLGGTQNFMTHDLDDHTAAVVWDRTSGVGYFGLDGQFSEASIGANVGASHLSIGSRYGNSYAAFRLYSFAVAQAAVPVPDRRAVTDWSRGYSVWQPREIYVVLVGGQSNADGRADYTTGPTWLQDQIVDYVKNFDGTKLEDHYWCNDIGPTGTGESWVTSGASGKFGFVDVATKILAETLENVVVCRVTEGSTRVDETYNARGSWHADYDAIDAINPATPKLLQELENKYNALVAYCEARGIKLNVVGLFWHQGESSASIGTADFQEDTEAVFAKVREFTGRPDLPIVSGTIPTGSSQYSASIESQMLAIDAADARVTYLDFSALTMFDGLHLDGASCVTAGTAAAAEMLSYL
jgi:hypothetical protein